MTIDDDLRQQGRSVADFWRSLGHNVIPVTMKDETPGDWEQITPNIMIRKKDQKVPMDVNKWQDKISQELHDKWKAFAPRGMDVILGKSWVSGLYLWVATPTINPESLWDDVAKEELERINKQPNHSQRRRELTIMDEIIRKKAYESYQYQAFDSLLHIVTDEQPSPQLQAAGLSPPMYIMQGDYL